MEYYPSFLNIDEKWVDMLLLAEQNCKGHNGENYIVCLLYSENLSDFNYNSDRFLKILQL